MGQGPAGLFSDRDLRAILEVSHWPTIALATHWEAQQGSQPSAEPQPRRQVGGTLGS